ncbi:MAG: hypothetical protein HZB16_16085 [Armatimonadetes bacterium]|nr:hypothetical protein [Armatimonadota bacterium]
MIRGVFRAWLWFAGLALLASHGALALDAGEIAAAWVAHEASACYRAVGTLDERQTDAGLVTVGVEVRRRGGQEFIKVTRGSTYAMGCQMNDRGQSSAVYLPSEGRVYRYGSAKTGRAHRLGVLEWMIKGGSSELVGDDNVAGRSCYRLKVSGGRDKSHIYEAWIDKTEFVALRLIVSWRGRIWRAISYDNVNFQAQLSDSDLDVQAGSATEVDMGHPKVGPVCFASGEDLRKRTGIRLLVPSYLPDGYQFHSISLTPPFPMNPFRRRVMVCYNYGPNLLMLVMGGNPPRGEREVGEPEPPKTPTEVRPKLFFWVKYDVRMALIGPRDGASDSLKRTADSVDWYDR